MNHNWHTKIRRLVPVSFWINRPPDGHFMLPKCYAQWASKFGKLSSGHKTGKDPFSFQSQRRAMPKNVQTTIQLPSFHIGLPWCLSGKESACTAGDVGSIPGSQRSPGGGHGNPLQYSWLENPLDRGAWRDAVHRVAQSRTQLKRLNSRSSKVMVIVLQARLQQYVNQELPDVQAQFRKGTGTRDHIANICWIIEKARKLQKIIYFFFIDYAKAFDCVDHNKLWKIL